MTTISVLVVDDHPVVTAGIEILFAQESDFTIVANVKNPQQAIEFVKSKSPDLVILDLKLGGNDGIELIKQLQAISKTTKLLVYSSSRVLRY